MKRCSLLLATAGLVMGAIALGPTRPAQAFMVSFTPTGSSDGSGIPLLQVVPSDPVVFDVLFDSSGLSSGDVVNEIDVYMAFDSAELFAPSYPGATEIPPTHGGSDIRYQGLTYSGLNIAGNTAPRSIGKISFTASSNLPADSELDFSLLLTGVRGTRASSPISFFIFSPHSSVSGLGSTYQTIKVQGPTTAVPTPALLPGMVAFGLGLVRKRKEELVG
jgi:hypothetical protein